MPRLVKVFFTPVLAIALFSTSISFTQGEGVSEIPVPTPVKQRLWQIASVSSESYVQTLTRVSHVSLYSESLRPAPPPKKPHGLIKVASRGAELPTTVKAAVRRSSLLPRGCDLPGRAASHAVDLLPLSAVLGLVFGKVVSVMGDAYSMSCEEGRELGQGEAFATLISPPIPFVGYKLGYAASYEWHKNKDWCDPEEQKHYYLGIRGDDLVSRAERVQKYNKKHCQN